MRHIICCWACAILIVPLTQPASADIVWSQLGGAAGAESRGGAISDDSSEVISADDFSSSSSWGLSSIQWWGGGVDRSATNGISSFLISILDASGVGGRPGTELFSTSIAVQDIGVVADQPPGNTNATVWRYQASLPSWSFGPGSYWMAIMAEAENPNGSGLWEWQGLVDGGDGWAFKRFNESGWTLRRNLEDVQNLAWVLEGSPQMIPLPAPVLLGGIGLLGLIPLRRRIMARAAQ